MNDDNMPWVTTTIKVTNGRYNGIPSNTPNRCLGLSLNAEMNLRPFTNAHQSDDYRCFSPEHKRMRFSQDWNGMAVSPESTVPAVVEEREPTVVEWWKQRKHNNHLAQQPCNNNHQVPGGTYHRSNDLCHVCQKPYLRPTITTSCHSSAKKPPKVGIKHHKTILSYFTPIAPHHQHASATGRSSAILPVPYTDSTEPYRCCSFCDRADVCSDCRNVCGTCEQWFCKFCTTTDYSTDPIRVVCLDCHQQQQPKEKGPDMELSVTAGTTSIVQQDAMQID